MMEAEVPCLQPFRLRRQQPPKVIPHGSRVAVIELGKCRFVPPASGPPPYSRKKGVERNAPRALRRSSERASDNAFDAAPSVLGRGRYLPPSR